MRRPPQLPGRSGRPVRRRASRFIPLEAIDLAALEIDTERAATQRVAGVQAHAAWRRAVGEGLRSRARVSGYHDGRFLIDVPDAAWKRELEQLEPVLLDRLRRCAAGLRIAGLAFRIRAASPPVPGAVETAWRPPASGVGGGASPEEASHVMDAALSRIADVDLRGRLWQVAGRCLAHRRL